MKVLENLARKVVDQAMNIFSKLFKKKQKTNEDVEPSLVDAMYEIAKYIGNKNVKVELTSTKEINIWDYSKEIEVEHIWSGDYHSLNKFISDAKNMIDNAKTSAWKMKR